MKRSTPLPRGKTSATKKQESDSLYQEQSKSMDQFVNHELDGSAMQPKLQVGAPENSMEEEAEAAANGESAIVGKATEKSAVQDAPAGVQEQIQSTQGKGQPLDSSVKTEMEQKFGQDFSDVNVHTDSNAAEINKQVDSSAATVGKDIYFDKGQYNPNSEKGSQLIAHELSHTVQQSQGGFQQIQRQNPKKAASGYAEWDGEITTMWNTPLRKSTTGDDRIADLDRGTQVKVIGEKDGWYKIKVKDTGQTGYVSKEMVGKTIQGRMEKLYKDKTKSKWQGSYVGVSPSTDPDYPHGKPLGDNDFGAWASGALVESDGSATKKPKIGMSGTMNCWEMILYVAMKSGRLKESWVKKLYQTELPAEIVKMEADGDPAWRDKTHEWSNNFFFDAIKAEGTDIQSYSADSDSGPKAGDLIFFNGKSHVAMATGKKVGGKTEILSFWPHDGVAAAKDKVEKTTVEALIAPGKKLEGATVTWCIPVWVNGTVK